MHLNYRHGRRGAVVPEMEKLRSQHFQNWVSKPGPVQRQNWKTRGHVKFPELSFWDLVYYTRPVSNKRAISQMRAMNLPAVARFRPLCLFQPL